ncbi:MAG: ATP-binding protein [Dehalococcoidia bacterium]
MRSLRARIALAYMALIVVSMASLGFALVRMEEARFRRSLDEQLLADARLVTEAVMPALRDGGGIAAFDPITKRLGRESGARVTIIAVDGVVLGDSENNPYPLENHGRRPEVLQALLTGVGRSTRHSATEQRDFTYLAVPVRDDGSELGIVRVSRPSSAANAGLREVALSVAGAAFLAALGATAVAIAIAGAVTQPLHRLRDAVRALTAGALEQRVSDVGGTEVSDLAGAFNEMAAHMQETMATRAQEHSRLEALLDASADALAALDSDGIIRYLNPAAESLFGKAIGRSFTEVARNHELTTLVRATLAGSRVGVQGELAGTSRVDGPLRSAPIHLGSRDAWVQATLSSITDGGDWAMLVILHDVTEVRRPEIPRRDFVANVSHELRTPLAGIKAVVETLRDGALHDPAAADDFLGRVDAEVDRLVQLVEELLQLSRIESGAAMVLTEVAPLEVLAASVERFAYQAERAGVGLALDAEPSLALIRADSARLGQAVGNLIHDAIKFTAPGGRISVTARHDGDQLCIAVADSGSGIDPADLPRIFERFYVVDRARSGHGTGLGLAIVKHVVRAHDGTVDATSSLGRGSTFRIRLPISRAIR